MQRHPKHVPHRVLSCAAPLGGGGLGQHVAQLVQETLDDGLVATVYCQASNQGEGQPVEPIDGLNTVVIRGRWWDERILPRLQRFSGAALNTAVGDLFDRRVASLQRHAPDRFMGFVGKSLRSFRTVRELDGDCTLELVAANSHVRQVAERHQFAARVLGVGDTWLGAQQIRKTLREYEDADLVYVHSDYTRDSMLTNGVPEDKLVRTYLRVHERFKPAPKAESAPDDVFRVVYAGRLDATKGIPLLIDAFQKLDVRKSELRLVGGYPSRKMREFCQAAIGDDERIVVRPGDPVVPFQRADVYVHPSFEDGFAYAPAEALACGTPVIVTEDTGMKEYVRPGENGYVVPTGEVDAIVARLETIRKTPLKSEQALLYENAMGTD